MLCFPVVASSLQGMDVRRFCKFLNRRPVPRTTEIYRPFDPPAGLRGDGCRTDEYMSAYGMPAKGYNMNNPQ